VQLVPLRPDVLADETRRHAVVGRLALDAAVQVDRALTVLVVAEGLDRQRRSAGFSSANITAIRRLLVPWTRVSAQRSS
jgi:hypothetical protein